MTRSASELGLYWNDRLQQMRKDPKGCSIITAERETGGRDEDRVMKKASGERGRVVVVIEK